MGNELDQKREQKQASELQAAANKAKTVVMDGLKKMGVTQVFGVIVLDGVPVICDQGMNYNELVQYSQIMTIISNKELAKAIGVNDK